MMKWKVVLVAVLTCMFGAAVRAEQGGTAGWLNDGTSRYPDASIVTKWSTSENVIWRTRMKNWSNATPVIVGKRLFICEEPTTLVCVDVQTGKILWKRANTYKEVAREGELPKAHKTNGYSSPTPVSDGRFVWAVFGNGVVACYDMEGTRKWIKFHEKPRNKWGTSASPLLVGDKLIVSIRAAVALDAATGKELWRVKQAFWPDKKKRMKWIARWGTPAHIRIGDTDVVVTPNGEAIDVSNGVVLAKKLSSLAYCGPMVKDDVLYFIENGGKALKYAPAPTGATFETLWTTMPKKQRYYASSQIYDGLIYAVTRYKTFSVIDAATGKVVFEKKLADLGAKKAEGYPSIVLAGKHLLLSVDDGTTVVLDPGPHYKEIARNKLESFRATPVVVGDRMYIRARKHLYCIGRSTASP